MKRLRYLAFFKIKTGELFDKADLQFSKRKVENYKTELEEKWVGTKVKHKDYGVVEIDSVNMLTEYWDDDYGVFESEVEFECHDEKSGDCITFNLFYAEDNLVEKEKEVELL